MTTHPIQYQCPIWRNLAARPDIHLKVFFASDFSVTGYLDRGFSQHMRWTLPLLDGYEYEFLGSGQLGLQTTGPLFGSGSLGNRLRRFGPTACLLNAYSPLLYWHAIVACRMLDVPVILRAETTDVDQDRDLIRRTVRDAALKVFYSGVSRFLAIGHNSRAHYKRLGVPSEKIGYSPYCIDSDLFEAQYAARQRGTIRKQLQIPLDAILVLFSGKLIPKKDPAILLKAVAGLPTVAGKPVHLVFLGDGELRARLESAAAQCAVERTHFLGFQQQENLGAVYTDADMLVLPSLYTETWGLVVNEALQFGVPCIVSQRVGCGADLIHSPDTGFVIPPGDCIALRSGIQMLAFQTISRGTAIHQMCRNAVSNYTTRSAADGIAAAAASIA